VAPPVFKTGLAGIAFAGGFDSLPPPPTEYCSLVVAPLSRGQHRTGRLSHHPFCDASQKEPAEPSASMRAHHD
jgi:hypothetical protein